MKKIIAVFLVTVLFVAPVNALATDLSGTSTTTTSTDELVAKVGLLIPLPAGETPTIATVTDPSKLTTQPFFANAKVGFKVLIYTDAKFAVLYDPVNNTVINSGPLILTASFFSDVATSNHNYFAIKYLKEHGMIAGYPDGTFKPSATINRAEFVQILSKGVNATPDATTYKNCFPDVKEQWFAPAVCYGKEKGWVKGYPDGYFRPEKEVNLAESLQIALKVFAIPYQGVAFNQNIPQQYKEEWYFQALSFAANYGIYDGDAKTVLPAENITRAKAAEHFYRLYLIKHYGGPGAQNPALWEDASHKLLQASLADYILPLGTKTYKKTIQSDTASGTETETVTIESKNCDGAVVASWFCTTVNNETAGTETKSAIKLETIGLKKYKEVAPNSTEKSVVYEVPQLFLPTNDSANYFKFKGGSQALDLGSGITLTAHDGIQAFLFASNKKITNDALGEISVSEIYDTDVIFATLTDATGQSAEVKLWGVSTIDVAKGYGMVHYTTKFQLSQGDNFAVTVKNLFTITEDLTGTK